MAVHTAPDALGLSTLRNQ